MPTVLSNNAISMSENPSLKLVIEKNLHGLWSHPLYFGLNKSLSRSLLGTHPTSWLMKLSFFSLLTSSRPPIWPLFSPSPSHLPISLHIAQDSCKSAQKTLLKQNRDSWRHAGSQFVILKKLIRTRSKTSTSKKGHWYWLGTHVMIMTLVGKLSHNTSGLW